MMRTRREAQPEYPSMGAVKQGNASQRKEAKGRQKKVFEAGKIFVTKGGPDRNNKAKRKKGTQNVHS